MAQAEILLIEDEATSRAILETVLIDAGYSVDTAETAAIAHSRLQAARYALVIADWLLPDGDGIFIADRAAALGSRTLIVTGHLSDLPAGTASRHHILMKPTKPESLLALVRALIGDPADQR
jgi:DNA-binding response OmpR family regulator